MSDYRNFSHTILSPPYFSVKPSRNQRAYTSWLNLLGFSFNPFEFLEASEDSHLLRYMVEHEAFSSVWGNHTAFVFAPPGGGKTAMRMRVTQACWIGQETNRPFPIPYVLPFLRWGHVFPSREEHLVALAEQGAQFLLLALAHHPHWFLRLDKTGRRMIRKTLNWNLPGPLSSYLSPCLESRSLEPLRERFPLASLPSKSLQTDDLLEFCDIIISTPSPPLFPSTSIDERWATLMTTLFDVLGFPAVYPLFDGLDATWETASNSQTGVLSLEPFLKLLERWSMQRIYAKLFLPEEIKSILKREHSQALSTAKQVNLKWNPALLAEVIRKRILVASQGEYDNLSALASPDVRDVETKLANAAAPLPREMIVLTRRVLFEHAQRATDDSKIDIDAVEAAIEWYYKNQPHLSSL